MVQDNLKKNVKKIINKMVAFVIKTIKKVLWDFISSDFKMTKTTLMHSILDAFNIRILETVIH